MWLILTIILIFLIISYFVIGYYFCNIALNPKKHKKIMEMAGEKTYEKIKEIEEQQKWVKYNAGHVYINSTNNGNLKLHAYEVNNAKSDIWVITIHGYMSNGTEMTEFAKNFQKMGYNVLMPDLRGHGMSEGKYVGMGWHDRLDIIDWINYILENNPDDRIILFGVSMGAATTMMTTGEELPSNVKLAISDCGYTSVWEEFSYQLKELFGLSEFPVLYAASNSCSINAKYSFKEASSIEQVKKSNTPTLFIHGNADDFVPFDMLESIYEAASCEKEKLIVEGAGHGLAFSVNPELYWKTIGDFIEKYLDK